MRSGFWKTDWFLGLVVVVLMLFAGGSDLLQSLERKAYDMGVQASSRAPSDKIAVIAIGLGVLYRKKASTIAITLFALYGMLVAAWVTAFSRFTNR